MTAKQLARIGVFYIEEAISTVLFQVHPEYMRAANLSRSIGIKNWDTQDWVISNVLRKMEADGRVETQYVNNRREGWKLTKAEYNRLVGEEPPEGL